MSERVRLPTSDTHHPGSKAIEMVCPTCGSPIGTSCLGEAGQLVEIHPLRIRAATRATLEHNARLRRRLRARGTKAP